MQASTVDLKLGEDTYRLRWDMGAMATFEQLTGENALDGIPVTVRNVVALVWAAVDADYASRDQETPVSFRKFGSLLDTDEKQAAALKVAAKLLGLESPPKAEVSEDPQPAPASRSRSRGATRSRRSTSDSVSASSGG